MGSILVHQPRHVSGKLKIVQREAGGKPVGITVLQGDCCTRTGELVSPPRRDNFKF